MSGIQTIRKGLTGNITKVIVIAIIVTFIGSVGWAGFLSQGNVNVVAKVGSQEITSSDLSFEVSNQQFTLSQRFPDQEIDEEFLFNLSKEVLIGKFAVIDFLDKKDLFLTDEFVFKQLSQEEQFLENGKFDKNRFDSFARSIGFIPTDYLKRVKEDLLMNIWNQSLIQSSFVTKTELESSIKLADQERDISFVRIPSDKFKETITIEEENVVEFYNNNLVDYVSPEQVKISYLEIDSQSLEESVEISEDEISLEYQDYLAEFDSTIRKSVSHIMLNITDSRDLAKAKDEIEDLKLRLADGETFESLVSEFSEDEGTKNIEGSLGITDGTLLPPEFEVALEKMQEGEVSGPIELFSSVHLIKLDELIKPEPESLEERTKTIKDSLVSLRAEEAYINLLDEISEMTFSMENIEEIAEAITREVVSTDFIAEEDLPDAVNLNSIKDYLFKEFDGTEYPELFETSQLSAVLVESKDYKEESQLSFEEVKTIVENSYLKKETDKLANAFLEDSLNRLKNETSLGEIAASQGQDVETYDKLKRDSSLLPIDVINTIFALPRSQAGKSYGSTILQNGDSLIYRLDMIREGDNSLNEESKEEFKNLLNQQKTIAELSDLQQYLEENISVVRVN